MNINQSILFRNNPISALLSLFETNDYWNTSLKKNRRPPYITDIYLDFRRVDSDKLKSIAESIGNNRDTRYYNNTIIHAGINILKGRTIYSFSLMTLDQLLHFIINFYDFYVNQNKDAIKELEKHMMNSETFYSRGSSLEELVFDPQTLSINFTFRVEGGDDPMTVRNNIRNDIAADHIHNDVSIEMLLENEHIDINPYIGYDYERLLQDEAIKDNYPEDIVTQEYEEQVIDDLDLLAQLQSATTSQYAEQRQELINRARRLRDTSQFLDKLFKK